MAFLLRVFVCIFVAGLFLYLYIDQLNGLTQLKLAVPVCEKELKKIREENHRLAYEIDTFESPIHLMELAGNPAYSHLKHPLLRDVITLPKAPQNKIDRVGD